MAVTINEYPRFRAGYRFPARAALGIALGLAVAFTLVRAFAMLGPPAYRGLFLLHCIPMALVPWLLLDKASRPQVGLKKSERPGEYPLAVLYGALSAAFAFLLGDVLFGASADHWFVSVANSFRAQPTPGLGMPVIFLMFTVPAILFSPIGEELFFRGYLQRMLETQFSQRSSTVIEGLWFAGAHLVHHGIFMTATGVSVRPVSGGLWFLLMLALSCMFAWLRKRHDSILPAIVAHAAFNFTMNCFIFGLLWKPAG